MQIDPPFPPPPPPPGKGSQSYRLYFLEGDGHISRSHEFIADDDAAAIQIAEAWREGRNMELWSRARKVATWP